MKKIYSLGLLSMIVAGCSTPKNDSYTIKGEIAGIPDSSIVILTPAAHRAMDPIAEAMVIDGRFEITGVTDEPKLVTISVKDNYGATRLMLENVEMSIVGTVEANTSQDGKTYFDFEDVDVTGSPLTDEFHRMMAPRYQLDSMMIENQRSAQEVIGKLYEARRNKDQSTVDSIFALESFQNYSKRESQLFAAFDSVFKTTVEQNSNTIWGPIAMLSQLAYLSPEQREVYESLTDSIKNTFAGKLVAEELYPVGRPGDPMPDFNAVTVNGDQFNLAEFCKGKKLVLLDFWASWCGPCRREIPNLKEIYKKHNADGFDIVSVSIDQDETPWKKAVSDEALSWTNLRDADSSISKLYKVSAVPTMYLVDGNGCLVAENLRGEELAAKIDELLSE